MVKSGLTEVYYCFQGIQGSVIEGGCKGEMARMTHQAARGVKRGRSKGRTEKACEP